MLMCFVSLLCLKVAVNLVCFISLAYDCCLPCLPSFLCVSASQLACNYYMFVCFVSFVKLVIAVVYFNRFFISDSNTELYKSNKRLISYI